MNLRPAPATSLLPTPGGWVSLQRMSGRTIPKPGHPITHHVAGARQNAPRTEIRLGARRGREPPNAAPSANCPTGGCIPMT
jgi:hypothetical protein